MKTFKRKTTVNGIEFEIQTSMYTDGCTVITSICNYNHGENNKFKDGFRMSVNEFRMSVNYENEESLKNHLLNIENKIKCIAESLNGWKTVSQYLEQEGFEFLD